MPSGKAGPDFNFISIDPGETVGWAGFRLGKGEIELVEFGQMEWLEFLLWFDNLLYGGWRGRVLIEDYVIRRSTVGANIGSDLRTVKVIGVLEWLLMQCGLEYWFEPPGIGNQFFNRKRLEELGMWIKGAQHSRSAIRLALYHISFGKGKEGYNA